MSHAVSPCKTVQRSTTQPPCPMQCLLARQSNVLLHSHHVPCSVSLPDSLTFYYTATMSHAVSPCLTVQRSTTQPPCPMQCLLARQSNVLPHSHHVPCSVSLPDSLTFYHTATMSHAVSPCLTVQRSTTQPPCPMQCLLARQSNVLPHSHHVPCSVSLPDSPTFYYTATMSHAVSPCLTV